MKNQGGGTRKEYLLLFEEPELFLHPKSTKLLREELYSLAENSPFQILCCTHSPQMVDISKPHCSLVRTCKQIDETTLTHQVGHDIFQSEINKNFVQMINRFDPDVCETFYASRVCLVEGDTEAIICREFLKACHPSEDIYVLNTGSKNNIPFFQRILTHFYIPHVIIHDSDTRYAYIDRKRTQVRLKKDDTPRANPAWTLNASIWKEIQAASEKGVSANRIVSVYDFESANGYEVDKVDGKPLSAYKFAINNTDNMDLIIHKSLNEIVTEVYSKEWNQEEIEETEEPHKG